MYKGSYAVEPAATGKGFMACEYTGKHGKNGAAYAGKDGEWKDLGKDIGPAFSSEDDAKAFIDGIIDNAPKRSRR